MKGNLPLAWIAGIISGASCDLPLQKLQAGIYLISLVYFIFGVIIFYISYFGAKKRGTLINMGEWYA